MPYNHLTYTRTVTSCAVSTIGKVTVQLPVVTTTSSGTRPYSVSAISTQVLVVNTALVNVAVVCAEVDNVTV